MFRNSREKNNANGGISGKDFWNKKEVSERSHTRKTA
jgi:hypothetical protein